MSFTDITEEGEGSTRTWIARGVTEADPTAPIIRDDNTPNKIRKNKQPKMTAEETARDEALAKVQAEEMKNPIIFPKLICEYCGEDFRDGRWLFEHQRNECTQKKALDARQEAWEARKRVYEIKYEALDRKISDINRLTYEANALKLELLEAKQKDEACGEVYAERKAEAARKKGEHEERVWYLNASDEERELHYFESTGLAEVEKHSEKVKALRAAIAEQKKERRDRITTKG
jgi:hypothetical protein